MHTLPCPETRRAPGTNKCIFLDNDTFSGNPWAAWAGSIATPLLPDFLSSFCRVRTRRTARSRAVDLLYYSIDENASPFLICFRFFGGETGFCRRTQQFSPKEKEEFVLLLYVITTACALRRKICSFSCKSYPAAPGGRTLSASARRGGKLLTCPAR